MPSLRMQRLTLTLTAYAIGVHGRDNAMADALYRLPIVHNSLLKKHLYLKLKIYIYQPVPKALDGLTFHTIITLHALQQD